MMDYGGFTLREHPRETEQKEKKNLLLLFS